MHLDQMHSYYLRVRLMINIPSIRNHTLGIIKVRFYRMSIISTDEKVMKHLLAFIHNFTSKEAI